MFAVLVVVVMVLSLRLLAVGGFVAWAGFGDDLGWRCLCFRIGIYWFYCYLVWLFCFGLWVDCWWV